MKTLLWAVGVLALEVLLLWEYFTVVGIEHAASRNVALASLVVAGRNHRDTWAGCIFPLHTTRRSSLIPSALDDPSVVAMVDEGCVEQDQSGDGVPYLLLTLDLYEALLLGLIYPYLLL
jgi:hypothetical protein